MAFSDLKKKSSNSLEELTKELTKLTKDSYNDERFWTVERDKGGNGHAIIRFLPASDGEEVPWVRYYTHNFKGPNGQYFIEYCPTTHGGKCYCCEQNTKYWNSGIESDKAIARDRKRKLNYVFNIYVVADPAHKENEGKVFLYKAGKKIFDKITECMQPSNPFDKPSNPFNLWTGRNFKLTVKTVEGYPNYDTSKFDDPSQLASTDAEMEKIWASQHKLLPLVDTSIFKSYEEIQRKYLEVTNGNFTNNTTINKSSKPVSSNKSVKQETAPFDEDETSAMDYFKQLEQQ